MPKKKSNFNNLTWNDLESWAGQKIVSLEDKRIID